MSTEPEILLKLSARLHSLEGQVRSLKNHARWVTVNKAGADEPGNFHIQQVDYLGKPADTLMIFPYGLHGNVPAGAFGAMFSIQGNPDNRGTIAWTPLDRPQLADGEVSFYHPPTDATLTWRANGDLDVETGNGGTGQINIKSGNINIESGDITIDSGDIDITSGDITVSGGAVDVTATDVAITSPLTTITGALTVTGLTTLNGGLVVGIGGNASVAGTLSVTGTTTLGSTVTSSGTDISNTHTHPQGDDSDGDTEQDTGPPQ